MLLILFPCVLHVSFLTDFDVFDAVLIRFGPCSCVWADFGVCGSLWPVSVCFCSVSMFFVLVDTFWSVSMLFGRFGCVWYVLARVHVVLTDFDVFGTFWSVRWFLRDFDQNGSKTGSSPEIPRRFPGGSPEVSPVLHFCSQNERFWCISIVQRFARIGLV